MKNLLSHLTVVLILLSVLCAQENNIKVYTVKSGIIEYKYSGSMSGTETVYFDNYGQKETKYQNIEVSIMGTKQKMNKTIYSTLESIITVDNNTKTGMKIPNPINSVLPKDKKQEVKDLGIKLMEKMGAKKVGNEKVLDKDCEVWEMMGNKFYIWNGFMIKSDVNMMGMKTTVIATKIELDVNVPADKFEVPKDIKFQKMPSMH